MTDQQQQRPGVRCKFADPTASQGRVRCRRELWGGYPHIGVCSHCALFEGDAANTVRWLNHFAPPAAGCEPSQKRREIIARLEREGRL